MADIGHELELADARAGEQAARIELATMTTSWALAEQRVVSLEGENRRLKAAICALIGDEGQQ